MPQLHNIALPILKLGARYMSQLVFCGLSIHVCTSQGHGRPLLLLLCLNRSRTIGQYNRSVGGYMLNALKQLSNCDWDMTVAYVELVLTCWRLWWLHKTWLELLCKFSPVTPSQASDSLFMVQYLYFPPKCIFFALIRIEINNFC